MELGIAAVTARLENGTLRIVEGACPNLPREAGLYRYATEADSRRGEKTQLCIGRRYSETSCVLIAPWALTGLVVGLRIGSGAGVFEGLRRIRTTGGLVLFRQLT